MTGLGMGAEFRFCEATQGFTYVEAEAGLLAFVFVLTLCCMPRSNSSCQFGQNGSMSGW